MSLVPAAAPLADVMVGGINVISLILAGIAGLAVLLAVLAGARRPQEVDDITRRLERYADVDSGPVSRRGGMTPRELLDSFSDMLQRLMGRTERGGRLAEDLAKADIKLKASEWVLGVVGASVVIGGLVALRFSNVLLVFVGPIVAYFGSGFVLRFMQARRLRAFDKQLGDTIILLSNALKAGYSFAQAIATVSKTAGPPIGEEFARATREMALGISVDDALNHMVKRNESEDFDLMVTAVQIHRVVGGNLAEILDTIAYTIRERVRIKGEIRTLTAQARASGWIITVLPVALAGLLMVISPDYFSPMFHQTLGVVMIVIGAFMELIGFALIQKIVKIEV
ncbi:MAG TPA: type II secretion system F family protein [Candidatus Dormibacteraeota bacterium]|nr:type II secretion system F family protein [Candidatus Dormibacteraeota bacterium]